jgi:DNA-directed RNA polymerase specialized sigma24 family protein
MTPDEVLAVCRLRQWAYERTKMRSGQVTEYKRQGWSDRRSTHNDARIVRVVDFERALSCLSQEHQTILILTCREHHSRESAAILAGMSARTLSYKLPAARQALASILDRLNLL